MNRGNVQKTPITPSLNRIALQTVGTQIQQFGKALPCTVVSVNGSIVTVNFEVTSTQTLPNVSIPKAESRWIRMPIQVGDAGLTMPADVYLGGITGLGGGVASMAPVPNLTALVFVPVGSTEFSSVNTNASFISGPEGVVLQTDDGTSSLVVNESGITMAFGGKVVSLTSVGFMIDGILFDTHQHISEAPGTPTGVPIA